MTRLVVNGAAGRMGRTVAALAREAPDIQLAGGLDRSALSDAEARAAGYPRVLAVSEATSLLADAQVLLDFSSPAGVAALLAAAGPALERRALVIGTTGLGDDMVKRLQALSERAAVLVAANFSIGVNLLLGLAEQAARVLPAERYDVEIVETHHRRKADAPSGTALALGEAVAAGRGADLARLRRDGRSGQTGERPAGEVGFHALRGGEVAGEHRVLFLGGRERIELAHAASERALFAEGALVAAAWMTGKPPGWYTMRQVLGLAG